MFQQVSLDDLVKKGKAGRNPNKGKAVAKARSDKSPRAKQNGRKTVNPVREPRGRGMVGNWGSGHQHDLRTRRQQTVYATPAQYSQQVVVAPVIHSSANKLLLSNLASGVTDSDMKELFSAIGRLRSACVHFDSNGKCLGTAEVVFQRKGDAQKAFDKYKGFALDGKVLKMSVVSEGGATTPVTSRMTGPPLKQIVYAPQDRFRGAFTVGGGKRSGRNNASASPSWRGGPGPGPGKSSAFKNGRGGNSGKDSGVKKAKTASATAPKRTKLTLENLNKEMDEFNSEKV